MNREMKFGLAVVGILLAVLAGVLVMRLRDPMGAVETSEIGVEKGLLEALKEKTKAEANELASTNAAQPVGTAPSSEPAPPTASQPAPLEDPTQAAPRSANPMELTDSVPPAGAPPANPNEPVPATPPAATDPFQRGGMPSTNDSVPNASNPMVVQAEPTPLQSANGVELTPSPMGSTPGTVAVEPPRYPTTADPQPLPEAIGRYPDYREQGRGQYALENPAAAGPPAAAPPQGDRSQTATPTQYLPANSSAGGAPSNQYDIYGRDVTADPNPPEASLPPQTTGTSAPNQPLDPAGLPDPLDNAPLDRPSFDQEKYTVSPNDNFWIISQKAYGTGAYFKALEEHNREKFPYSDRLRAGDVVSVPGSGYLEKQYPDLCPKPRQAPAAQSPTMAVSLRGRANGGRIYKVQQGDTLFDIARYELGKASRWAEIYELNRDQLGNDYDFLAPGMELVLPDNRTAPTEPLTTQSRQPYNR
jgi:nucleoid-associated protein YgaU